MRVHTNNVVAGVKNDDVETRERLDRSGEGMVGAEGGILFEVNSAPLILTRVPQSLHQKINDLRPEKEWD
jgi:hypothetical protein